MIYPKKAIISAPGYVSAWGKHSQHVYTTVIAGVDVVAVIFLDDGLLPYVVRLYIVFLKCAVHYNTANEKKYDMIADKICLKWN